MKSLRRGLGAIVLGCFLSGCGGDTVQPTAEQQAPDYGVKSMDKMKNMYGTPTTKGMKPATPAK